MNIVEASVSVSGNPGTTNRTQHFTAQNLVTLSLDGIASNSSNLFGGSGTIPGSAISFVPSTYSLPGSGTLAITIEANIPSGQRADSYVGSITTYISDSNQDSASFTLTVNPVAGYTATATSPSLVQGTSGVITVNVTNTGNAPIPYPSGTGLRYTVMDPFVSGANVLDVTSVATSTINIGYGASNSFNIMFNPGTTQPTGTYAGQVNLSYGGVNITLPLITTITPIIRQMSGSVTTGGIVINRNTSTVFRTIPSTLTLNNTGNYPLSGVTISISNLVGPGGNISGSSISISDNGFALAVGAGRTVTLTPAGTVLASGTYSGTITVSYGGTSTLSIPFSVTVSDAVASVSLPEVVYPSSGRNVNITQTITITNNGDYTLTGITLTTTASNTWVTTAVPGSLAVGGSFTA
ncbi:hypothetical protein HZB90_04740, partial [archaeon]|nr:hypothetical protein [archaeon]